MATKDESKAAYLKRRKEAVRKLWLKGLEPREIAAQLVRSGVITTADETLESAIRLVREDVRAIRAEVNRHRSEDSDVAFAGNEIDALERELANLRREHARQEMIAAGQPTEMCAVTRLPVPQCVAPECLALGQHRQFVGPAIGVTMTDTPQGMLTSYKALWPAGTRQKASKDAALLAEKIKTAELLLIAKREAERDRIAGVATGDVGGLTIIESEKSIAELIEQNLSVN